MEQGYEDDQANEAHRTKTHNLEYSLFEKNRALQETTEKTPKQLRY